MSTTEETDLKIKLDKLDKENKQLHLEVAELKLSLVQMTARWKNSNGISKVLMRDLESTKRIKK